MWRDALQIGYELLRDVWGFGELGRWLAHCAAQASVQSAFGALASLWLIGGVWLASSKLARWLVPDAGLPLRVCVVSTVGMWTASVGFHVLRSLHLFTLPFALVACTAYSLAVLKWLPGPRARGLMKQDVRAIAALLRAALRGRYALVNAVFLGFAAVLALRAPIIPPLGWDTTTYHGPRVALWLSTGQFTFDDGVGCYNFYRHFFSGGEVLMVWAMLPFHSDLLANLASVVQWIAVFFASWAIARELGLREPFAATSAGTVMFLPTLQLEVNSGYVELALNAALLQGIALALHGFRRPRPGVVVACALALGVAAGIKLPGIPSALIVALALAARWLASPTLAPRTKLWVAAVSCGCLLLPALPFMIQAWRDTGSNKHPQLTALPFMIQAWRDTGYPLSPMPVRVLGYTLGEASESIRWYQNRPNIAPYTWDAEKAALRAIFAALPNLNEGFGVLGVIPLLAWPIGVVALVRRRPLPAAVLCAAALAPVAAHFGPDLSAVRLLRAPSSTRFLIPFMALVVPMGLSWCRPGSRWALAYRRLLLVYPGLTSLIVFRRGAAEWEARELGLLAVFGVLSWAIVAAARRCGLRAAWGCAVVLWVIGLTGLQVRRDDTRAQASEQSYALHGFPTFWAKAVAQVDVPGEVHHLAITGGPDHSSDKWFHYFFLGRRFQNTIQYVTPTRDGRVVQLVKNHALQRASDRAIWLANLERQHITEVLSFPPRSLEKTFMDALPDRFERLAGDDTWGLYRLRDAPKP